MPGQHTCAPPVIVTLPAQLDAAAAEQAAGQITAAFTPGVRVVIADLTAAARCDRAPIEASYGPDSAAHLPEPARANVGCCGTRCRADVQRRVAGSARRW